MVRAAISGQAVRHSKQSTTAPLRGPSVEPHRQCGRKVWEGRSKEKGKATWILMASYNIRDGQTSGLQSAARALERSMVDITVLQEVKITNLKYALKKWAGCEIQTVAAGTVNCRGVALLVKENSDWAFTVKNKKVIVPNGI